MRVMLNRAKKINFVSDEYTSLTARECEIVLLVMSGLPNKAIARELHLSEGTVKIHLHNIFIKIGVKSRLAFSHLPRRNSIARLAQEAEGAGSLNKQTQQTAGSNT